jgi:hypothetical protein
MFPWMDHILSITERDTGLQCNSKPYALKTVMPYNTYTKQVKYPTTAISETLRIKKKF